MQTTIILVHGTFAGQSSYRGENWWQLGGNLITELQQFLNVGSQEVEFIPFQWSGENSERERSDAAKRLRERIKELLLRTRGKVIIIGHSHGGSVAYKALAEDRELKAADRVKVITVGTPFFSSRVDSAGAVLKRHIIYYLSTAFLTLALCIGYFQWELNILFPVVVAILWFTYTFLLGVTLLFELNVDPRYLSQKRRYSLIRTRLLFNAVYLGIPMNFWMSDKENDLQFDRSEYHFPKVFSRNDEAINALSLAPKQAVSIATYGLLKWPCTFVLSILFFFLFQIISAYSPSMDGFAISIQKVVLEIANVIRNHWIYPIENEMGSQFARTIGIIFISVSIAMSLYRLFLGRVAVYLANTLIKQGLLDKAYGKDTRAQIGWVSANPPKGRLFYQNWRSLPRDIDDKFDEELDQHAASALRAARVNLGLASVSGAKSIDQTIFGSLRLNELVHTSYFEQQEIRHLIAWMIVHTFGLKPSAEFTSNVNHDRCKTIFDQISPSHYVSDVELMRRVNRRFLSRKKRELSPSWLHKFSDTRDITNP